MAKLYVTDWSTTAASNTDANSLPIDGSVTTASQVDDLFREIMAQIASFTRLGADTATASTLNLDTTPNMALDLTGTTTVTAVTLTDKHWRIARAAAAFQITASSTLVVNGSRSTNYTTTAGDLLIFIGYSSSTVRVWTFTGGAIPQIATAAEVWAGTNATKIVPPSIMQAALAAQALTDGATVTVDFSAGINFTLAIGGNRTLAASNLTNVVGRSGYIKVTQDATGSRTLDMSGSTWLNANGQNLVLSTAANTVDYIFYQIVSSTTVLLSMSRAVS